MRCQYDTWKGQDNSHASRGRVLFCECALCREARKAKAMRYTPALAAVRGRFELLGEEREVPLDSEDEAS